MKSYSSFIYFLGNSEWKYCAWNLPLRVVYWSRNISKDNAIIDAPISAIGKVDFVQIRKNLLQLFFGSKIITYTESFAGAVTNRYF